ncbi:MAG: peptidoglycan bridge formation glycyltransferase FemA/FemB family protein [Patescibacteria group bacterium]
MMKSFLQTQDWLDFQKHVGRKTWRFDDGKIKANIIQHDLPFGKNYLYIPHGPEVFLGEIQSGLKNEVDNFLKHLKDLGRENKSIFIKMEPMEDVVMEVVYRKGLKHSKKSIQPARTVIVDLNLSEEELLSKMHHKTRYNINLASRKNLVFKESDDIEIFWKLLRKTAKKDQFQTHDKNYYFKLYDFFKNNENLKTELFIVEHKDKAIAAALIMFYEDTACYLHGAMDRNYKELMAPYFMHWEVIKHAKSTGHRRYDLWGIDAKRWPGVTRFKLGFGGQEVECPGSFDLPISKIWYLVYKIARKIF